MPAAVATSESSTSWPALVVLAANRGRIVSSLPALDDVPRATPADLDAFPRFRDRQFQSGPGPKYRRPVCRGPIAYEHREPLRRDLAALHAAVDGRDNVAGAFMNAPSAGVIALFLPNEHYPLNR